MSHNSVVLCGSLDSWLHLPPLRLMNSCFRYKYLNSFIIVTPVYWRVSDVRPCSLVEFIVVLCFLTISCWLLALLFISEDGSNNFLRNVIEFNPCNASSHIKRDTSSCLLLWESQMQHPVYYFFSDFCCRHNKCIQNSQSVLIVYISFIRHYYMFRSVLSHH